MSNSREEDKDSTWVAKTAASSRQRLTPELPPIEDFTMAGISSIPDFIKALERIPGGVVMSSNEEEISVSSLQFTASAMSRGITHNQSNQRLKLPSAFGICETFEHLLNERDKLQK